MNIVNDRMTAAINANLPVRMPLIGMAFRGGLATARIGRERIILSTGGGTRSADDYV
jgi:hypothetical protein